ncbi:rubrerythrin-like domain-containing protein [Halalkalicoccus sp. NIPERK01]
MGKKQLSKEVSPNIFECMDCGHRMEANHHPMECPDCEGEMLNISNPRE